jgi:hypothetical protein
MDEPHPHSTSALARWRAGGTRPPAGAKPSAADGSARRRGSVAGVVVVLVVVVLYLTGHFDTLLYKVGLNVNRCAQNGYGAVFCGKALDEYEGHVEGAEQEARGAAARLENCERYGGAAC